MPCAKTFSIHENNFFKDGKSQHPSHFMARYRIPGKDFQQGGTCSLDYFHIHAL